MAKTVPATPSMPMAIAGGTGTVPAWARPELLVSAPGGIAATTPAHCVWSTGQTTTLTAGQDIDCASQRHTAVVVKGGLSFFTYGKASNPNKPNAETGLQMHAASGNVSVRAQANTLNLTADKAVEVSSVTNAITMGAPKHILLTAGGGSLRITQGAITLTTSGPANFKAAMKELSGAQSAQVPPLSFTTQSFPPHFLQFVARGIDGQPLANKPYVMLMPDGAMKSGVTDAEGKTERVETDGPTKVEVFIEDADHEGFYLTQEASS